MNGFFETFGKYRLTQRLAIGGMAEVFLGTVHGEAGFSKAVVIKRLHPRLSEDREFVQMFIDEARITSQLSHTNICQVLDLGKVGDSYYISMEFISGEDLRTMQDHARRAGIAIPIEASAYIISEVLAGLDYAHRKEGADGVPMGIIHRDISPQNILVSYEGEVKVIDFGIAKARTRIVSTEAGVIKGKFRYMSPEQASGADIDHRSDIFSAGVVLYELLCGRPHSMDLADTEILRRMQAAEFEPIRKIRPEVPVELERILKKVLSRKRSQRPARAEVLRASLLQVLYNRGISYGRSELSKLICSIFDEDRRRRRSGTWTQRRASSFDIERSVVEPEEADTDTEMWDQTRAVEDGSGLVELTSSELVELAGSDPGTVQDQGWAAYAPTHAAVIADEEARTRMARRSTEADPAGEGGTPPNDARYVVVPRGRSGVQDSDRTRAYHSSAERQAPAAALAQPEPIEAETLARMPLRRPPSSTSGSLQVQQQQVILAPPFTAGRDSATPEATAEMKPAAGPAGGGHGPEQAATRPGHLHQRQTELHLMHERTAMARPERSTALRTMGGVLLVMLLGGALAVGLYIFEPALEKLGLGQAPRSSVAPPDSRARTGGSEKRPEPGKASPAGHRRKKGQIRVQSKPPGARISLCGRPTGKTTPAVLTGPRGRSCPLELTLEDHEPFSLPVVFPDSRPVTIQATLRRSQPVPPSRPAAPRTGHLRVTSIQVGTVYVNDRAVGQTPQLELDLRPGTYSVKVVFPSLDGQTSTQQLVIRAGRTTTSHFETGL